MLERHQVGVELPGAHDLARGEDAVVDEPVERERGRRVGQAVLREQEPGIHRDEVVHLAVRRQMDDGELLELIASPEVVQELLAGVGAEEDVLAVEEGSDGLDLAAGAGQAVESRAPGPAEQGIALALGQDHLGRRLRLQPDPQQPRLEGQVERLALAPDDDGDPGRLGIGGLDLLRKIVAVRQPGPGVGEQHIAGLDAGAGRVRAGLDGPHQQAVIGRPRCLMILRLGRRRDGVAQGQQMTGLSRPVPVLAAALLGARRTSSPTGHS